MGFVGQTLALSIKIFGTQFNKHSQEEKVLGSISKTLIFDLISFTRSLVSRAAAQSRNQIANDSSSGQKIYTVKSMTLL